MLETNVSELCPNSRVPAKAKIRIAIADDRPIFRDGLCRLLSLEGFKNKEMAEKMFISEQTVKRGYRPAAATTSAGFFISGL
jgi:hypothetical protein